MRSLEQPRRQPKRDKSRGRPLWRQGPRDQKSARFLVGLPAPKISEIFEPLAFPKGSKISEILEPLGSPQEAFERCAGKARPRASEMAASGRAVLLRYSHLIRMIHRRKNRLVLICFIWIRSFDRDRICVKSEIDRRTFPLNSNILRRFIIRF